MKTFLFEELHPKELKKIIDTSSIVYLPLGTLEWHERHLPLGLDGITAYEISKRVCKKAGGCVIPPLYFGTDREHEIKGKIFHGMDARVGEILLGSIYFLKQDLFYQVLKSIANNVALQGFRKLVVISGHGGTAQHNCLLELAKEKIDGLKIYVFSGKSFPGGLDHAGHIETNLMMAIRPNLVKKDRLKKPYKALSGEDPKGASEEIGNKSLNKIVSFIAKEISV